MKTSEKLMKKLKEPEFVSRFRWLAILLVAIMILGSFFMSGLLVLATIFIAVLTNMFRLKSTGIELATLSTVIFGAVYGVKVGALMGLVLIILQLLGGLFVNVYNLWVVPGYVIAGAIAGLAGPTDIVSIGMAITIGLHIFFTICTAIFTTPALAYYAPYALGNIIFNLVVFNLFASKIVSIMI